MTHEEVLPYINKPVRITLDDGRILAGRLAHAGKSYTVVSSPLRAGEAEVQETISSSTRITTIEDASSDPAAR